MQTLNNLVTILYTMKRYGAAIYGMGRNGKAAYDMLEQSGINIVAFTDQLGSIAYNGKKCMEWDAFNRLNPNTAIVVTPNVEVEKIIDGLKSRFTTVTDRRIIDWMMYFVPDEKEFSIGKLNVCNPFNHYESPYPILAELKADEKIVFNKNEEVRDIFFNEDNQLKLLSEMKELYSSIPAWTSNKMDEEYAFRYYYYNNFYSSADAILLHCMIRIYKPCHIIEIGSGFSTCIMLDTNEINMENKIQIKCIEPYPQRLYENIKKRDRDTLEIQEEFVQRISIQEFMDLEAGDFLFIDSSHVARMGGDIIYEYFEILPRLQRGVLIHIHDIFYPFSYPKEWIYEGRAYNEAFILRALLMNSDAYEILFFNDMMIYNHFEEYQNGYPIDDTLSGGSIWLRKK